MKPVLYSTKKAQLQTMETIAVLFVFFLLLGLGMIFYVVYANSQADQNLRDTKRILSSELALTAANLPELQSSKQGIVGINSLDVYKIEALSNIINESEDSFLVYSTKFGNAEIIVRQIWPGPQRNWTIYSNIPSNPGFVRPFFIPFSLHDPRTPDHPLGRNYFGIMEVWYYG
jgi:hypothetical protein